MATYNPFEDLNQLYTYYQPLNYQPSETNKVTVTDPLFGDFDLPDGFRIGSNGSYIAPANTPEAAKFDADILNKMAATHAESSSIKLDLSGNKKKAMEFFMSKGLSSHHSAGIVGNLMGESGLNPEAINPTSKAFGIAQWLGDRKKKLISKYGNKPTFDLQLEFVWEELNSNEKSAYDKLLQTKNVDEAINSFMKHFERPSQREMAQSISNRLKYGRGLLS